MTQFHEWTQELLPAGSNALGDISSFGEDAQGELYLTDYNQGAIFKIVPASHTLLVQAQPNISPVVIRPGGGTFTYQVSITNPNAFPVTFDFWDDVFTPSYHSLGLQISRFNVQIPAGATITRSNLTQSIPGTAAPGTYYLRAFVGDYPTVDWDASWFSFVKQAGTADLAVQDWAGGGWDEISEQGTVNGERNHADHIISISPNPFNPTTGIRFQIPEAGQVNLKVYDTTGRLVAKLVEGWMESGVHDVTFDGSKLPSGIYLYRIQVGEWSAAGKMVLIK
jgi:hypothetical protein